MSLKSIMMISLARFVSCALVFNSFSVHSDRKVSPPPNPIPNYLSLEDLNHVHFCRNFYNFSFAGYSVWLDRRFDSFFVKIRGFKGHFFDGSLSFQNPHLVTSFVYSDFKVAVRVFRFYCLRLIDAIDREELFVPVNSVSAPVSEFVRARRSRIVTRVFKTRQPLLPAPVPRFNGWLFDIF